MSSVAGLVYCTLVMEDYRRGSMYSYMMCFGLKVLSIWVICDPRTQSVQVQICQMLGSQSTHIYMETTSRPKYIKMGVLFRAPLGTCGYWRGSRPEAAEE